MVWDPQLTLDQQPDLKFRAAPWVFCGLTAIGFAVLALVT